MDIPELIKILPSGKRGRPRKIIDLHFLREATANHRLLKKQEIADILGIHRTTLYLHMKRHGILQEYSKLSGADLDILTKRFKTMKPESGLRYLIGFLRRHGLRIQNRRVRASMKRVDQLGKTLRSQRSIRRRTYHVKRPNSLWHLDGHHKLIRWGIVIHGFIDGYSRLVSLVQYFLDHTSAMVADNWSKGQYK